MRLPKAILAVLCIVMFIPACKQKPQLTEEERSEQSYFSIKQFIEDQYNLKKGQPYIFKKIVKLNGKSDTTDVPFNKVDWASVFGIFGKTDISDPRFYEKYYFNNVDDNALESSMLIYTAKDPDMFVQKLNVGYDNITNKISTIYIETADNGRFHTKLQKLSYYMNNRIIINEYEKTFLSPEKDLTVTYLFPQPEI